MKSKSLFFLSSTLLCLSFLSNKSLAKDSVNIAPNSSGTEEDPSAGIDVFPDRKTGGHQKVPPHKATAYNSKPGTTDNKLGNAYVEDDSEESEESSASEDDGSGFFYPNSGERKASIGDAPNIASSQENKGTTQTTNSFDNFWDADESDIEDLQEKVAKHLQRMEDNGSFSTDNKTTQKKQKKQKKQRKDKHNNSFANDEDTGANADDFDIDSLFPQNMRQHLGNAVTKLLSDLNSGKLQLEDILKHVGKDKLKAMAQQMKAMGVGNNRKTRAQRRANDGEL